MKLCIINRRMKRIDFESVSELKDFCRRNAAFLSEHSAKQWDLYKTKPTGFSFCRPLADTYKCTLYEYIVKHQLINYEKVHQKDCFAVAPCGERL